TGARAVPFTVCAPWCDGAGGRLLRVERNRQGYFEVQMDGGALAVRAVRVMAQATRDVATMCSLVIADLAGVVAHGGNGRMPALLARQLDLSPQHVWSETPRCGNLGAASLPVAWAAHQPPPVGPIAWVTVGAGLTWAAAMSGLQPDRAT